MCFGLRVSEFRGVIRVNGLGHFCVLHAACADTWLGDALPTQV